MRITAEQDDALRWPRLTEADHAAVKRVLDHGDLSAHPVLRELEDAYAHRCHRRHALSHANGTAALAAAFFALDLAPGDEIIVPSATWWASVSPMLYFGLVPVFADSDPETLGLDPADVAAKITPRTRAIVIVHLWGLPAAVKPLLTLAREHNLRVIEDASHAHGASVDDSPLRLVRRPVGLQPPGRQARPRRRGRGVCSPTTPRCSSGPPFWATSTAWWSCPAPTVGSPPPASA